MNGEQRKRVELIRKYLDDARIEPECIHDDVGFLLGIIADLEVKESRWIPVSERLPDVKEGHEKMVLIAFKSELGRDCVAEAHYLNRYELMPGGDYEPKPEDEYDDDNCTMKWSGFCWLLDESCDEEFRKVNVQVTHWMEMPLPPAPSSAANKEEEKE